MATNTGQLSAIVLHLQKSGIACSRVADDLGASNRAQVLRIEDGDRVFYLKLYSEPDYYLASHERTVLAALSLHSFNDALALPVLYPLPLYVKTALADFSSQSGYKTYEVFAEEVKGRALGGESRSLDAVTSVLCDAAESILAATLEDETEVTPKTLHHGQGIFIWVSEQEGVIPVIDYGGHWEEYGINRDTLCFSAKYL